MGGAWTEPSADVLPSTLSSWHRRKSVDKSWREMCNNYRLRMHNWKSHVQRPVNCCRVLRMLCTRSLMLHHRRLAHKSPSLTPDHTRASSLSWAGTAVRASGVIVRVPRCHRLHHPTSLISKVVPPLSIQMLVICMPPLIIIQQLHAGGQNFKPFVCLCGLMCFVYTWFSPVSHCVTPSVTLYLSQN